MRGKVKQTIDMFHFWCGKLGLPSTIPAVRDNRIDSTFALDNWDNENICLRYHSRRIGQKKEYCNISDILHEIGHIKNKLPYDTEEEKIESEYRAELFSIRLMKKYYPQQYGELIGHFFAKQTIKKLKDKMPIHYKAFIRIRDYKNTIKKNT